MQIYQAVILGVVQGLTELLPVSSSAHLNLIPWIFNWQNIPEGFDVALHIGTLLAIVIFFAKDWIALIKGGFQKVVKKEESTEGRIFWYIVIATIPAGILSLVLEKIKGKLFDGNLKLEMIVIAISLIVMGIILYIVDKRAKSKIKYEQINLKQSVLIGVSQAIAAAFPGVSRSGITMTVARGMQIERESAARYSFLLSTPIVLAAALYEFKYFEFNLAFLIGIIVSFIVGLVVIKFLLKYLQKGSFKVFAIYRVVFGIFIIAYTLLFH